MAPIIPLEKPYYLKTADKDGRLKIIGYCRIDITFEGAEIPGGAVFEVAENLREGIDGKGLVWCFKEQ